MNVPITMIKSIAEGLPIGLYAKRRIPVAIDEEEPTSYYNPVSDEIVISSKIIQEGLKHVHKKKDIEPAVRSMLYHEVSHSILTPNRMKMTDWMNIFEDERIETILGDYFLDVDFKKQVLHINGFKSLDEVPNPAPTAMAKFYSVVRFGIGEKKFVDEVDRIIKDYAKFNSSTYLWQTYRYIDEVKALYRAITGEEPPTENIITASVPFDADGEEDAEGENTAIPSDVDEETEEEKSGDDAEGKPCHGRKNPLKEKEIEKLIKSTFINNKYVDTKLTDELSMILENFSKKNNSGSALAGYSGTFNTRAVVREDYKYFERKASINGSNKFGTFHLNLFIDESGSFYRSETAMNTLLRSLTDIERKNPNFTLDVVFCGISERLVQDKRHRIFKADGGNRLDKKTYELYRKLQKPNTYNYTIACFDGDACSDGGRSDHGFGAFDHNNCVIISDYDNERYIRNDVHSARVIYTRDYTNELIKNVVDALEKAFR